MTERDLLIDPCRVVTIDRMTKDKAPLAGFLKISDGDASKFKTYQGMPRNRFRSIAHIAQVDGVPTLVVPVFMNTTATEPGRFLGDNYEVWKNPWYAFFKGKAGLNYATRFPTIEERIYMLQFFGEDLGFMFKKLIVHT